MYFLHQRFINQSRLLVARFKETQGRLPTNPEFVVLVAPLLDQPLPAPVSLIVSDSNSVLLDRSGAHVSGDLRQGVYGDAGGDAWAPASEHFRTVTSISTPGLSFSAANHVLLLTWPANAGAFMLYSTTNLAPPTAWIRVVDSVVLNDGEWQVRIQPNYGRGSKR